MIPALGVRQVKSRGFNGRREEAASDGIEFAKSCSRSSSPTQCLMAVEPFVCLRSLKSAEGCCFILVYMRLIVYVE